MATATGILPFSGGVNRLPETRDFASPPLLCEANLPPSTIEASTTPNAAEFMINSLRFIKSFSLSRLAIDALFDSEKVVLAANDQHIFRYCRSRHKHFTQRIARD